MNQLQPPEGLQEAVARLVAVRAGQPEVFTENDPGDGWVRDHYLAAVNEVLIAIDEAGYVVLPAGGGHVIEFREDGWTISSHPLSCQPGAECPVNRVAERDLIRPVDVVGRFECDLNDLGDRLLIGDRIEATS